MPKCLAGFAVLLMCSVALAADAVDQLIKADHWKRARDLVETALKKNPNDAHALAQMAMIKHKFGDLDGAQKDAERAIALDPKNADAHVALADVYGDQAQKAGMFKQISLAHSIHRELDAAITADPANVEAHYGLMLFLLEAPGIAGGDKKKVKDEIAVISKLDPVRGLMAEAEYAQHQKAPDTGDLYRKAHDAAGNRYDAAAPYCSYLAGQKLWDEAEKCATDLVKRAPDRVFGYSVLAIVHASQSHWKELDLVIPEAEKNIPDNLNPEFQAARVLAGSGADNPRAERYLRKYLTQEPEGGYPKLSRAHWRLAQVLEKAGRKPEAVAELEITTRMEPGFKPAADDLKRLR